jgi:ubiquitin-activating enzyme E1
MFSVTSNSLSVIPQGIFSSNFTISFSPYESFGWCTKVKQPRIINFRSLSSCNQNPGEINPTDFGKFDHPLSLHLSVLALDRFMKENTHAPRPWNNEDADELVKLAKTLYESLDVSARSSPLNEDVVRVFAKTCCGEVSPLAACFGGIAAQEVLKACSGKFTPITQFLFYDAFEALPERAEHGFRWRCVLVVADCVAIGSRYDGQILLFGQALQQTLADSKLFLVGAGAIGCEMLKNLAMMGVATGISTQLF